jgi:hypothetical protein
MPRIFTGFPDFCTPQHELELESSTDIPSAYNQQENGFPNQETDFPDPPFEFTFDSYEHEYDQRGHNVDSDFETFKIKVYTTEDLLFELDLPQHLREEIEAHTEAQAKTEQKAQAQAEQELQGQAEWDVQATAELEANDDPFSLEGIEVPRTRPAHPVIQEEYSNSSDSDTPPPPPPPQYEIPTYKSESRVTLSSPPMSPTLPPPIPERHINLITHEKDRYSASSSPDEHSRAPFGSSHEVC